MLRSRRLSLVTRVFPQLFCRSISLSTAAEKAPTTSSSLLPSSSDSGESCSESEDGEENGTAPQAHQIKVLRAYLRNRRTRCLGRVREQGLVPAVVVDPDRERRPKDGSTDVFISLDAKPLVTVLKLIGKRDFVSRVFDMDIYRNPSSSEIKESLQVLPRNLNYGPGKTNILNIQFVRAPLGQVLRLGVPLEFLGLDQCPGLKKGGTLKKLAKYVVYNCKAAELPAKIVVDMSVLEIGDRVRVQDLEVDFDHLHSDRTMVVCEIVKDVRSLKAKARKLKDEIFYKKKALAQKENSTQAHALSDDEIEVSDDGQDEVIPYRYQKSMALAKSRASNKKTSTKFFSEESDEEPPSRKRAGADRADTKTSQGVESMKSIKPSRRRLTGTSFVSSREKKLHDEAEPHYASASMKKHKVLKVSGSEDERASPSFARKHMPIEDKVNGEMSGLRGQREQRGGLLSSRKCKVFDHSVSGDEDEVRPSRTRKRTALERKADFDSDSKDDDDEAYRSRTSKASVGRRASGFRGQKGNKVHEQA